MSDFKFKKMRSGNSNYWDYIENYWFLINYNVTHIRHSELKASIIITAYGVVFGLAYDVGSSLMIADKYKYTILPGSPEESLLVYSMNSTDPGIMMPELGRKVIHKEGVALIEQWIKDMKP